jgi:uncharacterized protein
LIFLTHDESFCIFIRMIQNRLVHEYFTLYTESGEPIHGEIRSLDTLREKPVVIICHSFMAFKDWGFFPYIAKQIAEAGFVSVIFNFSLNGVVGDEPRITDFEKFERNTISREISDLGVVIDAVAVGQIGVGIIRRDRIFLLGHSRGSGVAILRTADDQRIRGLVSLGSVGTFWRWTNHQKKTWRELGYLPLAKDSTTSPLRLGIDSLNDIELNAGKLNLENAASKIEVPWLIIHGMKDVTVPPAEAQMLYDASNKATTTLVMLEKTGHLFNAQTKDEDNYATLGSVLEIILKWLHSHNH